ncbi:MAG: undecaprenyl-diphosphatase [Puniceicoccaceae bacterium]|nr:MAG: undecaprenyl-diphosphatase [Puniceicoccaceae bacterium]
MTYWEAILLGLVQGLTEFLPISSTAHIVLAQRLLGLEFPGLVIEVFLHLASVLAVLLYFRREVAEVVTGFLRYLLRRDPGDRVQFFFGLYIAVATVITGVLGLLLQQSLGDGMKSTAVIAGALAVTGAFLVFIERFRRYGERRMEAMTFRDSVLVGLGQTVSVLPGISRSGATLVAALLCGLERETAVKYSFLLAIPVILGSSVLAVKDWDNEVMFATGWGPLVISFLVCFAASLAGIIWLIDFLRKSRLIYFAIYCFAVAVFVFLYFDHGLQP